MYGQNQLTTLSDASRPTLENYRIGPGDVIDIVVSQNETLSRNGVRVNQKGTIQIAMVDHDVTAACLTERELADLIRDKYKKYLVNPFVNVAVREFNSTPVALIGAVNTPGRFQLQRPTRLLELLTFVNGPSQNAGRTVEIIRSGNRAYCDGSNFIIPLTVEDELISLNLDDILKGSDQSNPLINAGDIVRVAAAEQVNAYIMGNVRSAAAINLKDPVSLSQAVAMAGGLVGGADAERIKLRRQVPNSINREELIVNLKAINQGKADDILLVPNDIIDVPGPSGSRKILQTILRTIIPTVTQLPMTVIRY
jgi:polysaccharide export outer membrane protein